MAEVEIVIDCDEYGMNIEVIRTPKLEYQKTNVFYLDGPNFTIGEPLQVKNPLGKVNKPITNFYTKLASATQQDNRKFLFIKKIERKNNVEKVLISKKTKDAALSLVAIVRLFGRYVIEKETDTVEENNTSVEPCPLCCVRIPVSYLRVASPENNKIDLTCRACSKDLSKHVIFTKTLISENTKLRKDFIAEFSLNGDESVEKITWLRRQNLEDKILCEICGKHVLWSHHRMVHDDSMAECKFCKSFVLKRNLARHRRESHVTMLCAICGKTVMSKMWYRHRMLHGEKKFKCTKCDIKFHYKKSLVRHQLVHDKDQSSMYSCKFCGHFLTSRWNLQQHIRIHTKVTPYKCLLCKKYFRYNCSLKSHIILNHPGKSIPDSMTRIMDTSLGKEKESMDGIIDEEIDKKAEKNGDEDDDEEEDEGEESEEETEESEDEYNSEQTEENADESESEEMSEDFDGS